MKNLVIFFFLLMFIPELKAQINLQDSLALVDLYKSTGGANWGTNTNWLKKIL